VLIINQGGKENFLKNVTVRKGLPTGTRLHDLQQVLCFMQVHMRAHAFCVRKSRNLLSLSFDVGVYALPHPFKMANGSVGFNQRDFGALPFLIVH
jgi:hypothetical protein